MDVARTPFILIIAAAFANSALAAPQSTAAPARHTANYAGQSDWASGPAATATIGTPSTDRYGNPIPVTQRATNAVTETANTVREGFYAGTNSAGQQVQSWTNTAAQQAQAAGSNVRTSAQQAFGTAGYQPPSNNPFATSQPAAPAASANSGSLAPPPWTTGSSVPAAAPAAPSWTSNTLPVTPVDRSVLASPQPAQSMSGWTSIGSTIPAPPLLAPTLPSSGTTLTPFNTSPTTTSAFDSGPVLSTDSYRGSQPSFSSTTSPAPQSSAPNIRTGSNSDDFASAWDGSANNNRAPTNRTADNTSRPSSSSGRDTSFGSSNPFNTNNTPEVNRTANSKQGDGWSDDSWTRNAQSPPASAPGTIGPANNSPFAQQPANSQPMNQPIGTTVSNGNFGGQGQISPQLPMTVNAGKPLQPSTVNSETSLGTYLIVILVLAGSLAANIYLGWSYIDARQKYQSLVRRTADTFRRSSQLVAA